MTKNLLRSLLWQCGFVVLIACAGTASAKSDPGKKACAQEAKRLCPAEMKAMSRKRVEACMIAKINETSDVCHAAMLRIKAERGVVSKP